MEKSTSTSALQQEIKQMKLQSSQSFYDSKRSNYFDIVYHPVLEKVVESKDPALFQELIEKVQSLLAEKQKKARSDYWVNDIAETCLGRLPYYATTMAAASGHRLQDPAKQWLRETWSTQIPLVSQVQPQSFWYLYRSDPTVIRNVYKLDEFLRDFPVLQDPDILEKWMITMQDCQKELAHNSQEYSPIIRRELAKAQEELVTKLCQSQKTSVAVLEKLAQLQPSRHEEISLKIAQAKVRENQSDLISSQKAIFESKLDAKEKTRAIQDRFYTAIAQAAISHQGLQSPELIDRCLQSSPRSYTFLSSREDLLQAVLYRKHSDFKQILQFFRSREGFESEPGDPVKLDKVKNANSQDERFLTRLIDSALAFQSKGEVGSAIHKGLSQNYILLLSETMGRYRYKDNFLMRLMGTHFLDTLIMKTMENGITGHPDSLAIQGLLMTHVVDVRLAAKFALENPHCGYWQEAPSKLKEQMERMTLHSTSRHDLEEMLLFIASHREKHPDARHKADYDAMVRAVLQNYQPGLIVRTLGTSAAYYEDVSKALQSESEAIQTEAKAAKRDLSYSEFAKIEVLHVARDIVHQKIFSLLPQGKAEQIKGNLDRKSRDFISVGQDEHRVITTKRLVFSKPSPNSASAPPLEGYEAGEGGVSPDGIPIATAVVVNRFGKT